MPQRKEKFELVAAVVGQEVGNVVELEVGEDGLPVNRVYKHRTKKVEVATPKPASKTKRSAKSEPDDKEE